MDYEKKYKEALDRAKKWHNAPNSDKIPTYANRVIEEIFPELKESEDESAIRDIRVVLESSATRFFKENGKMPVWYDRAVAWLEKHGEPIDKIVKRVMNEKQRVLLTETNGNANIDWDTRSLQDVKLLLEYGLDYIKKLEKQGEQKSVNKAESKSKIIKDTWYVCTYTTCTEDSRIWFRKDIAYLGNDILKCNLGFEPEDYQKCFRLWTIEDAKEGDVLANDKSVFIYAKVLYSKPYAYCGVDKFGVFKDNCLKYDWSNSVDNIHPATKEQRDLLFQKMKEEGYEWDAKTKELKKIQQKPTWSEEDENSLLDVLWCCKKVASIAKDENEMGTVWCAERWLNSLKDRYTWKPTKEQVNAIRLARSFVTDDFGNNPTLSETLLDLEKQLKKVMEGNV